MRVPHLKLRCPRSATIDTPKSATAIHQGRDSVDATKRLILDVADKGHGSATVTTALPLSGKFVHCSDGQPHQIIPRSTRRTSRLIDSYDGDTVPLRSFLAVSSNPPSPVSHDFPSRLPPPFFFYQPLRLNALWRTDSRTAPRNEDRNKSGQPTNDGQPPKKPDIPTSRILKKQCSSEPKAAADRSRKLSEQGTVFQFPSPATKVGVDELLAPPIKVSIEERACTPHLQCACMLHESQN